ncbi:MAG: hypothetical protein ACK5MQ_16660 [Pikeienuella sp.]
MLALICLFAGLVTGWVRAAKRGGETADKLQYAIGHGLAFGLAGFAVAILLARSGLLGAG